MPPTSHPPLGPPPELLEDPPAPPEPEPKSKIKITGAQVMFWLWMFAVFSVLGIIYYAVTSEGVRSAFPTLGQKISRVPIIGLGLLKNSPSLSKLDLANVFSFALMVGVFLSWEHMLLYWIKPGAGEVYGWDSHKYRTIVTALAVVIIFTDSAFFYMAVSQMSWGQASFSFKAALVTAAYLCLLIGAAIVSLNIKKKARDESEE